MGESYRVRDGPRTDGILYLVRVMGVDFGRKRIGLALSDASGMIARPWRTIVAGQTPQASASLVAAAVHDADEDERPAAIVVGLPRKLSGDDTDQTAPTRVFVAALEAATALRVHLQDERLTSREAESRLALRERDWRKRKEKIDATAAAIILQDYLDTPRVESC